MHIDTGYVRDTQLTVVTMILQSDEERALTDEQLAILAANQEQLIMPANDGLAFIGYDAPRSWGGKPLIHGDVPPSYSVTREGNVARVVYEQP